MFELPEDLSVLDAAGLTELLAAARAEAATLMSDLATADVDRLEVLADAIDALSAALDAVEVEVEVADEAADARLAALTARLAVESDVDDVEVAEVDVVEEVQAIAATVAPKRVARPAAKLTLPAAKKNSAIVAAAGIESMLTLSDAIPHLIQAWDGLKGTPDGTKRNVFSITTAIDPKLVANGRNDHDVVAYAVKLAQGNVDEARLAAGGWCAPAEQRYDICNLAGAGLYLNLPSISVPRGSVSYFRELDYRTTEAEILPGIGSFTVAELEALPPVVKPCVEVPCKDPVTFELGAESFCIRAGVLQRRAFPELVEAWVSQALTAYQHYLNGRRIAEIVALASANTVVIPASFGAIVPFLDALDLQAADLRFDHGMSPDATVEGFAPWWLPIVFRADAAKRQFDADWNFTKAEINSALAARNIRLQWVEDYNDAPFRGVTDVTALPTTVDVVLYPAGAYLDAGDNILRVGALQDSTLLTTNREQILFVEQSFGILPACGNGRIITIPLCASGETAGPVDPIGVNTCG